MQFGLWEVVSNLSETVTLFFELVFSVLAALEEVRKCDFAMMLWCLWKPRNDKVWEGLQQPVLLSIQLARDLLHQWCCARQQGQTMFANNNNNNVRWQPPVIGTVKYNIDAALFNYQQKFGVGMCIRNDQGNFMKAKTMWFHGTPPPQEVDSGVKRMHVLAW
jgi:hypothetical protein